MKQYGARLLAVVLICCLLGRAAPVFAAGTVSFSLDDAACDTNRLVDVAVHAQGDEPLCAALFEIRFDGAVLAFRDAAAPDGSTVVASAADGGSVRLSYLCAQGAALSGGAVLFTLCFKAVAEGSTAVSFTVSECVGADAAFCSAGSCTAGTVTVRSPAAAAQNRQASSRLSGTTPSEKTASRTRSGSNSRTASTGSRKSGAEITASSEQTLLEGSTINDVIQQDQNRIVPLLLLCLSIILSLLFAGVLIVKLKQRRKEQPDTKFDTEE